MCGRYGQIVLRCYYRFDIEFQGANSGNYQHHNFNSTASIRSSTPPSINTLIVQDDLIKENFWYPDSGASNYVTNDLANLNIGAEYQGDNMVLVGNGAGLDVHHICSSSLKSSHNTLFLKNIFHVPHITKNLLSVSQLCKDNNVFFEFHPVYCFVKDPLHGGFFFNAG